MSLRESIEEKMDKSGLAEVLSIVAEICGDKAEHIRGNWQDEALAKKWDRASIAIHKFSSSRVMAID